MKKAGWILLLVGSLLPASGQLFSPESVSGAILGTVIGGIAGSDCHHGFSGQSAAIGAGAGFLAGAIVGEINRRQAPPSPPLGYYAPVPQAQPGYGYVYAYPSAPAPVIYAPAPRPNYAVGGTMVGALTGGLIGAANHQGWEGAGIGAASGLVLGSVAEVAARKQEQKAAAVYAPPAPVYSTSPAMASPRPPAAARVSTAIKPVPQIPDAPRVPDAPTF